MHLSTTLKSVLHHIGLDISVYQGGGGAGFRAEAPSKSKILIKSAHSCKNVSFPPSHTHKKKQSLTHQCIWFSKHYFRYLRLNVLVHTLCLRPHSHKKTNKQTNKQKHIPWKHAVCFCFCLICLFVLNIMTLHLYFQSIYTQILAS